MKKILNIIIILAVCVGLGFAINGKIQNNYKKFVEQNELRKQAVIDIPDPSIVPIHEVGDASKPIIVFFYVDWCGYCKRFMPIYGEVAKEYNDRYNFAVAHCEKPENKELVKEFEVQSFPTLYIIDRKVSFKFPLTASVRKDAESLKKELDNYLNVRKHFAK